MPWPQSNHRPIIALVHDIETFALDTLGSVDGVNHPGFGKTGWPAPAVGENLNRDDLSNLGLSDHEEKAIVAFLKTLTDDYPKWGNDRRMPQWVPAPFAQMVKPRKGGFSQVRLSRILRKHR